MPLIGQHQQTSFTGPLNGNVNDAAVVLANDTAVATVHNAHDADATIHLQSSTLASRAAFGVTGRVWITSDGLRLYYDIGSGWSEISYPPYVNGEATITSLIQGATHRRAGLSVAVNTSATVIDTPVYAGVSRLVVVGTDSTPNTFLDVVAYVNPVTPTVISSSTIQGTPAVRTYTVAGGQLKLAMASGLYTVRTAVVEL